MSNKLPSYLKTHRRHYGLTQDEIAFLLGSTNGTRVSRYERLLRRPDLATAFGCQVIFGPSPREMFPGIYLEVEDQVFERVTSLATRLRSGTRSALIEHKLRVLGDIEGRRPNQEISL